jgi:post-segregation antitoxin (ccd killing protein)
VDRKEIRVTQEMIDEARRLRLTGSDLVMAAIKKAIERDASVSLDEGSTRNRVWR